MNNIKIEEKLIRAVVSRNQNYTKINYHMNKNIMLQLIANYDETKDCVYMLGLFGS